MPEWFAYDAEDPEVEGGVLEFPTRVELHVYQRRGDGGAMAVWLSDDALYCCQVDVGEA